MTDEDLLGHWSERSLLEVRLELELSGMWSLVEHAIEAFLGGTRLAC